ncbi:MAG: hypothetical protein J0H00_16260 [Burkholderiales bacterium]|nr:hypothetical protein [Burkholderiales bacterium]
MGSNPTLSASDYAGGFHLPAFLLYEVPQQRSRFFLALDQLGQVSEVMVGHRFDARFPVAESLLGYTE